MVSADYVVIPPEEEPINIAEAKEWCRATGSDEEDGILLGLIPAARQHVEVATARALVTQTRRLEMSSFRTPAAPILIPRSPVQSIESVAFGSQTLDASAYVAGLGGAAAWLSPAPGTTWPAAGQAVQVTYVAGYGDALAVPALLRQAVLMLIAQWFDTRATVNIGGTVTPLPHGVEEILRLYRIPVIA